MRWKTVAVVALVVLMTGFIFSLEVTSPSKVSVKPLQILYSTFNGSTTNFDSFNQSFLYNLPGVILEKTLFGKVAFNSPLNIVAMAGPDWIVNFDRDLNISNNLINVDNYNLPGINKSANLSINNISVPNPVIYNKGVVCNSCNLISYLNGTVRFSTPLFSGPYYILQNSSVTYCGDGLCNGNETYATCPTDCQSTCGNGVCDSGETHATCPSDCPSVCGDGICDGGETSATCPVDCGSPSTGGGGVGGGGGSGTTTSGGNTTNTTIPYNPSYDFYLNPTLISSTATKGTYIRKYVNVTNNGTATSSITIGVTGVTQFVFPEVTRIVLKPNESKLVTFDMYFPNDQPANVYVGNIVFRSPGVQRETRVVINLKQQDALFDLHTVLLKKYINPGSRVRANVTIVNMGDLRNFDVNLEYKIIDFNNKMYNIKDDQFAMNRTYNGIFYIDSKKNMPVGNYVFYAVVRYKNVNATAYDTFTVEKVSLYSWLLLILIILILMYFVYDWYKRRTGGKVLPVVKRRKEKEKELVSAPAPVKEMTVPDID